MDEIKDIRAAINLLHIEVIRLRGDIENLRDEIAVLHSRMTDDPVIKALKVLVADGTKEIDRLRVEAMKREGSL